MKEKILIFSGAGISAESGIQTFRDMGGLWHQYRIEDVATPEAWARNPELVLDFYNQRRQGVRAAQPNAGHLSLVELEQQFEVVIVTQNIDDLHERAGSSHIIHVHGEIMKARSSVDENLLLPLTKDTIELGELCPHGSQLRPHVVWFGEAVQNLEQSASHFLDADKIIVVGTSLSVYPVAGLTKLAKNAGEKYLIGPEPQKVPYGYHFLRGTACQMLPHVVKCWLEGRKPV